METHLQSVDIHRWVIRTPTTDSQTNCLRQAAKLVVVITPRAKKSRTEKREPAKRHHLLLDSLERRCI